MCKQNLKLGGCILLGTLLLATVVLALGAGLQAAWAGPVVPPVCGGPPAWTPGPPADPGRWGARAAVDAAGDAWVVGGLTAQGTPLGGILRYNALANTWETAPPLPVPVGLATAGWIGNNLYVAGGWAGGPNMSNGLQIYNRGSNTWQPGPPLPFAGGLEAASGAALNGFFYVIGGDNGQALSGQVWRYDPVTQTWALDTPLPGARSHAAATAANGRIYLYGGVGPNGQTVDQPLAFDPNTHQWLPLPPASLGGLGNFPGLSPYGPGQLIATDGGTTGGAPGAATHLFDFNANAWAPGPPLPAPLLGPAEATLGNGFVLVYGGLLSPNTVTDASALLPPGPSRPLRAAPTTGQDGAARVSGAPDSARVTGPAPPLSGSPTPSVTATGTYTVVAQTCTPFPFWTVTVTPTPTRTGTPASPTPTVTGTPATSTPAATLPAAVSISGNVYANNPDPADALYGAYVYACAVGGNCTTHPVSSDIAGHYSLNNLVPGQYYVYINPPGASNVLPNEIGPLTVHSDLTGQDVVLHDAAAPPTGTTLLPTMGQGGIPLVSWNVALTLTTQGCAGGSASYQIFQDGTPVHSGGLTEGPAGTFTAYIAPLSPLHGSVRFVITIICPGGPTITIVFDCYIDPSGVVRTVEGYPIPGATVTLFRAADPGGPFVAVPDGSGMLSPANRHNPDTTTAAGHFGWDVIAGYYKVRAARTGCYAPGNPSQPYVESAVLPIPPPVSDLDLRLSCPGAAFSDVHPADYFYAPVEYLASMSFLGGYADGTYRPYNNVTRGQLAKIVAGAAGFGAPSGGQTFADLPPTHPFYGGVEALAARAIVSGYACGGAGEPCDAQQRPYFRPYANLTRGQLAKIVANAAALRAPVSGQTFADIPAGQPFYLYVERAVRQGILGGYACGGAGEPCDPGRRPYFRPANSATRGQTAKIVANTAFPDNPAPAP